MSTILSEALEYREGILSPETDCCRLIDGIGDGFPDVFLEEFAGRWLVSTRDCEVPSVIIDEAAAQNRTLYWKRLEQDQKTSPSHLAGPPQNERFVAMENGQKIWIDFQAGYSQGIFLDQRNNRLELRELLGPGKTLLNTFAYTGAFSVSGALAGAVTTTLDLSQPYLDWAKENLQLNDLDPTEHYFCKGDTLDWLRRFAKSGRKFDAIVLDPPTFSRDAKGKVWKVEKDYHELVRRASACLAPGGTLLATTNCRKLPDYKFELQILEGFDGRPVELEDRPMPPDFTGEAYLKTFWCFTS